MRFLFQSKVLLAVLGFMLWAVPQAGHADCFTALHDRVLAMTCLQARVDAGVASPSERRALERRQGQFGLNDGDLPRFDTGFRIRPVLGGASVVQEEFESGVEAGLNATARWRAIVAPGQALRFRISATEAVEPLTLDRRAGQRFTLCSETIMPSGHQVDLCNNSRVRIHGDTRNVTNNLRLTLAGPYRLSPTRQGVLRFGIERYDHLTKEFVQPRFYLAHDMIDHEDGTTHLGLTYAMPVSGHHLLHWRLDHERRWGVFIFGSHFLQKTGEGYDSLGTGVSLGFQNLSRIGMRFGIDANEDGRTNQWEISPRLGFDVKF